MRLLLMLFVFTSILHTAAHAQRKKRYQKREFACSYHVQFKDIFSGKPISGIQLHISDSVQLVSDSAGYVHHSTVKSESSAQEFYAVSIDNSYESYRFQDNYIRSDIFLSNVVYLTPTIGYDKEVWIKEDSIYGSVKENNSPCGSGKKFDTADSTFIPAEFPGGVVEMQRYIATNIEYPVYSIENDEQGKVCVSFVVEKDGNISHIKIQESAAPRLNKEAVRVVRSMPKWQAGKNENGEPERVRCKLPINFTMY